MSHKGITPMSLSQLLAENPKGMEWLVDGLLPASGTSLVAAKPKVGKSTLVRVLSVAVSEGAPFLSRRTRSGPVLYLALEENAGAVASHFKELGATDNNLHIYVGPSGTNPFPRLKELAGELRRSLIIVDPLFRFVRVSDGNAYAEVTTALEPFFELAESHSCHVMLVHHAGKVERAGGDGVLGSTAIIAAVDTALLLTERGGRRSLRSIQRYGTELAETALTFHASTRDITLGQETATNRQPNLQSAIVHALGDGELSAPQLKGKLRRSGKVVNDALKAMVADGSVSVTGNGIKNDPKLYRNAQSLAATEETGTWDRGTKSSPRIQEKDEPLGGGERDGDRGAPFLLPLPPQSAPRSDLGAV